MGDGDTSGQHLQEVHDGVGWGKDGDSRNIIVRTTTAEDTTESGTVETDEQPE